MTCEEYEPKYEKKAEEYGQLCDEILQRFQLVKGDGAGSGRAFDVYATLHGMIGDTLAESVKIPFRPRDVEPLIEQAGSLLNRALIDRASYQEIGEKFANLRVDLYRTCQLIAVADVEIDD